MDQSSTYKGWVGLFPTRLQKQQCADQPIMNEWSITLINQSSINTEGGGMFPTIIGSSSSIVS